jgi:hypothetical protein
MPFQSNRNYLHDRTVESLGLLYAMHWPFRQTETARGGRRSGRRSYPGCGTGLCRVVYSSRGRTDHARREEEKVAGPSPASH